MRRLFWEDTIEEGKRSGAGPNGCIRTGGTRIRRELHPLYQGDSRSEAHVPSRHPIEYPVTRMAITRGAK